MISACVVPTVKHGGGGVMVGGALMVTLSVILFRIQGTLNQHGYRSILQRYAIPSGLGLVRLSFVFQQDNDPTHISRLFKGYLTNRWSGVLHGVLHQMTWPPQSPDLNQLRWDDLYHRVKETKPTNDQNMWELLQDCWKAFLMKLS
jgi:hypothetical protein